nr:DUF3800 domain-containing protein [Hyphomicrobium facile]
MFSDEFGDQALKAAASEFFIVSAVVVAAHREPDLPHWVNRINQQRRHWRGQPLHFTDLDERAKLRATRFIGKLPLRCFTLISHKGNMINYRNVRAERAADLRVYSDDATSFTIEPRRKLWYSHMVLKALLERATEWCLARSHRDYGEPRPVAITIAQRGGFYLDRFKTYLEKDRRNLAAGTNTLPRNLAWPVVDLDLITTAPASNVAGLQLADIVSGSFSRAVDERRFHSCDTRFVANLGWRIARKGKGRRIAGWGVTGLPWNLWEANLSADQEKLFRMFGYDDEKLVRPGPILPED